MAKKYYSLLTRTDGKWSVQFGDYDKAVVVEERDGTYCDRSRVDAVFKKDTRIITTDDAGGQAAIDAAVARINDERREQLMARYLGDGAELTDAEMNELRGLEGAHERARIAAKKPDAMNVDGATPGASSVLADEAE